MPTREGTTLASRRRLLGELRSAGEAEAICPRTGAPNSIPSVLAIAAGCRLSQYRTQSATSPTWLRIQYQSQQSRPNALKMSVITLPAVKSNQIHDSAL